jgi:predicted alpha/beta superfamily hydrolase
MPEEYERKKNQSYPVVYLLDANVYFEIVAGSMKENKTKSILVGIGYSDFLRMDSLRNRDYTFPEAPPGDSFPVSGNALNFLAFITNELFPYIDKNYRSDTLNRTLMGHSLGGYFTLFAMEQAMQDKHCRFKNYVAASPSLEYSNSYIINLVPGIPEYENACSKTLYVTFGGREDSEDGGTGTTGMDNFNLYVKTLTSRFKNIDVKSEVFPTYAHMETAIPTFTKSLKEIK